MRLVITGGLALILFIMISAFKEKNGIREKNPVPPDQGYFYKEYRLHFWEIPEEENDGLKHPDNKSQEVRIPLLPDFS